MCMALGSWVTLETAYNMVAATPAAVECMDQGRMDIKRDIHRAGQTWMDSCTPD